MHTVHKTPAIELISRPTGELESDLLVIPVFEDDDFSDEPGLDHATRGEVTRARGRKEFRGKLFEVFVTNSDAASWKTPRVALVGAGKKEEFTQDRLRRIAIVGGRTARERHFPRIAVVQRAGDRVPPAQAVQVIAEGMTLANYEGAAYKTDNDLPGWIERAVIRPVEGGAALNGSLERGVMLGSYSNEARALANEPGNRLTPRAFADRARDIATQAGLRVEVLDEQRLAAMKMGLLLGVAQGSDEPPRMLVMRHEPENAIADVTLGFIGKGITFDTGGISIKPADNMDKMKDDMSGGAAVICAMSALSRLKAPVRCVGVVPMTENMPSGRAIRPGDVLTSAEGKTVEILNTDAEGRLILGDALWYARQLGATHLVDVATLTGACVVALGKTTSGLFGRPDEWLGQVLAASERAGDRSWPMPIFDDYMEQLKSEIADFSNTGGRAGGAITGALFIKEFAGDRPWVHMDIAGTAWAEEAKPYQPKGATGVAVRTLAELALNAPAWSKLVPAR